MSMQFSGQGTREGVLKRLADHLPKPAEGEDKLPPTTDRAQVESVRAFIASEIKAMDPKVNGVRVICEANAHGGARSIQITIMPMELHV